MASGKPQDAWAGTVDNFRPMFIPLIRDKLNALKPMDPELVSYQHNPSLAITDGPRRFGNVYEYEIKRCLATVVKTIKETNPSVNVIPFSPLESTPLDFIDSEAKLDLMIEEIIQAGEVAIDLEHHDHRSYLGFTSLMQLSTREKDYIVDPFPIFTKLHRINRFTTDPNVKKVLHGAELDIQWLQRDFGVYVVNMFDTGQAASVIGFPGGFGLANLLDKICGVKTDKKFQMADWRTRPLSKDMLQYARLDTHYLLHIRDVLEEQIYSHPDGKSLAIQIAEKSFGVSLKVYEDPLCDYDPVSIFVKKQPAARIAAVKADPLCMKVLQLVLRWRDMKARKMDESKHFILSNASCSQLAGSKARNVRDILVVVGNQHRGPFPSKQVTSADAEELLALFAKVYPADDLGTRDTDRHYRPPPNRVLADHFFVRR